MKRKPNPQRRTTRLRDYDYTQPGSYFVTICTHHKKCLFGTITAEKMQLNDIGDIAREWWHHIPQHFPAVELGDSVIMPNHIHGIITLPPHPNISLGKIIAYFKYQATKHINQHGHQPKTRIWQRNYYDHIIRDETDLQRIRLYIHNNPMKWALDQLHPNNPSRW